MSCSHKRTRDFNTVSQHWMPYGAAMAKVTQVCSDCGARRLWLINVGSPRCPRLIWEKLPDVAPSVDIVVELEEQGRSLAHVGEAALYLATSPSLDEPYKVKDLLGHDPETLLSLVARFTSKAKAAADAWDELLAEIQRRQR